MTAQAFGPRAAAVAARFPEHSNVIVAEPQWFDRALPAVIDLRARGRNADVFVVYRAPREELLEALYPSLQATANTHDALVQILDAFAAGTLTLNNDSQATVEAGFATPQMAWAFRDLCLTADRILFASYYDLHMTSALFNVRPSRWAIYAPPDTAVPLPPNFGAALREGLVIWTGDAHAQQIEAVRAMCFDLRLPQTFLTAAPGEEQARTLSSASVILSLSNDPATVRALSGFARPICAPRGGAGETVEGVFEFDAWDRVQLVDAVQRALGAAQPRVNVVPELDLPAISRGETTGPLVSIVMPTYSRPQTLERALAGLQRQTYANIEIIVVNNAGTPVAGVVERFPNARLIDRDVNTGNATRPRNDGIAAARGEYVAFLDDDDVFFDDHIQRMVAVLERGADAVYSDFFVRFVERDEDGSERLTGWDLQKPAGITPFELFVHNRLGYLTVMVRRALISRIGSFDENDALKGGEELEYWLRIASHTDFVHVDQPSTAYTVVRDWRGQLSEKSHALYATGFETLYGRYPVAEFPLVRQARLNNLHTLRSSATPPPMHPRYAADTHAG